MRIQILRFYLIISLTIFVIFYKKVFISAALTKKENTKSLEDSKDNDVELSKTEILRKEFYIPNMLNETFHSFYLQEDTKNIYLMNKLIDNEQNNTFSQTKPNKTIILNETTTLEKIGNNIDKGLIPNPIMAKGKFLKFVDVNPDSSSYNNKTNILEIPAPNRNKYIENTGKTSDKNYKYLSRECLICILTIFSMMIFYFITHLDYERKKSLKIFDNDIKYILLYD